MTPARRGANDKIVAAAGNDRRDYGERVFLPPEAQGGPHEPHYYPPTSGQRPLGMPPNWDPEGNKIHRDLAAARPDQAKHYDAYKKYVATIPEAMGAKPNHSNSNNLDESACSTKRNKNITEEKGNICDKLTAALETADSDVLKAKIGMKMAE